MEIEFEVLKPEIEADTDTDVDGNSVAEEEFPTGIEVLKPEIEEFIDTDTDENSSAEEETLIFEDESITEMMPEYSMPVKTCDHQQKLYQYNKAPSKQTSIVRSDLDLIIAPSIKYVAVLCHDLRPLMVEIDWNDEL